VARTLDRLGLDPVVTCLSGISDDELARQYAAAQVAVVPSLYAGFSLPAIEAMACGVPVVTTTGGALPEVVGEDGSTALLVPPDDPEALAGALRRVLGDPELAHRLGTSGRQRVLGRFTWEATARGTVEQYRALLGGPGGGRGRSPRRRRAAVRSSEVRGAPARGETEAPC
jgi:glycosyltransferase involved in cell wall biosynthesis